MSKRIALDAHDLWGRAAPEARAAWGEGLSRARRRGSGSFGAGAGGQRLEWSPARADAAELAGALARYSVVRENPREDADSFQTAWYLYGLEHFGNVPLIEPPEEREERRLETLAVVAYRQPITRMEVEQIRGVQCDRAMATLVHWGLIEERGRRETVGRPILYGTTEKFLQHFALSSLEELPKLMPVETQGDDLIDFGGV